MPVSLQLIERIKKLNNPRIKISSFENYSSETISTIEKKQICKIISALNLVDSPKNSQYNNSFEIAVGAELDQFLDTFAGSQVYSIDAFLAKYIDEHTNKIDDVLVQIGKVVLIYYIAKFENETCIGYHKSDWIQFIINEYLKNTKSRESFFKAPPILYTFNYDRILERSLVKHLTDFHFIDEMKACGMIETRQIKHIYGDLGSFQNEFNIQNISHVKEAISRIRVIGEERLKDKDNLSTRIYDNLKDLKRVYILGYGYDKLNNDLLFSKFKLFIENRKKTVPVLSRSHPVLSFPQFISTNINLSEDDCRKIASEIGYLKIQLGSDEKNLGKNDSFRLLKVTNPFHQAFIAESLQAKVPHEMDYL